MTGGKAPAMMPCPGCGAAMAIAADTCASCGRDNEIVRAYMGLADNVAREHGFSSMDDAARTMAVMGPMLAGQVRRAAAGLSLSATALLWLFSRDPNPPMTLPSFLGSLAVLAGLFFVGFWWLLGGRNTSNPFALVRPVQLWLRRAGGLLLLPAVLLIAVEVAYLLVTGSRLCPTCG